VTRQEQWSVVTIQGPFERPFTEEHGWEFSHCLLLLISYCLGPQVHWTFADALER
jgi:hypothetical protein